MKNYLAKSIIKENQSVRVAIQSINLITLIIDRFSHSVRGHLGVSLGVLDDLCLGHQLSLEDIHEARLSLQKLTGSLEALRDLSRQTNFSPEPFDLIGFLCQQIPQSFGLKLKAEVKYRREDFESGTFYVDKKLLTWAMRSLFRYLALGQAKEAVPIQFSLKLTQKDSATVLSLGHELCINEILAQKLALEQGAGLLALARVDHRPEALGLIFIEQVLFAHGAQVALKRNKSSLKIAMRFFAGQKQIVS